MTRQAALEFFAGIGLVRLGLSAAGWQVAFANDIDRLKYRMYADNFPDATDHYRIGDVWKIDPAGLPDADLAQASFPCVDLSLAGYRRGLNGIHSGSYWGFVRILRELKGRRPSLLLIENVTGFITSNRGGDLRTALEALGDLGYRYDAFVLNAVHFVPQSRPRLFIIGMQERPAHEVRPAEALMFRGRSLCPGQLGEFLLRNHDLPWSFLPIPEPPPPVNGFSHLLEELHPGDPRWWSNERVEYLLSQMSPRHRALAERMINAERVSYGTAYRRMRHARSMAELRADGVAGCLRTPRGGSSRQILFVAGEGECRARFMTPREYARLQGVPDWYKIRVPANQALFGFGDAVCVPAIQWIAENVLARARATEKRELVV